MIIDRSMSRSNLNATVSAGGHHDGAPAPLLRLVVRLSVHGLRDFTSNLVGRSGLCSLVATGEPSMPCQLVRQSRPLAENVLSLGLNGMVRPSGQAER